LVFSKEAPDILFGLARNLTRLGALPEKLVWDRESAIAAGGRPTVPFAAFWGAALGVRTLARRWTVALHSVALARGWLASANTNQGECDDFRPVRV
jgi:hypothetical protein